MISGHSRPLRRAGYFISLLLALLWPGAAIAQFEAARSPQRPPEQTAADRQAGAGGGVSDILNLDIEQLAKTPVVVPSMDIPVTSVAKQESTVGRSPAAVFVITNEMIRRSGATTIAEALRMAPGLEVARVNSNTWAITSRGFNGVYADKLLVLIDGRTVYTPISSGVYWDTQDVLLEDVERIEVVRGPGGTLWGANAVNGVISIITKSAKDTQGAYASVGGGTQERFNDSGRIGGRIGEDFHYRVYGKHFERGPGFDPTGHPDDSWRQGRFGFRTDWDLDRSKSNSLTVQGDCYTGLAANVMEHTLTVPPYSWPETEYMDTSGQNVLMRWRHVYNEDSDWTLQVYYDNFVRARQVLSENVRTFDVDFQYRFPLGDRHRIICGAGYRHISDECFSGDPFTLSLVPPVLSASFSNQFVQDEIALVPDHLELTLGCKLEQNYYTGLEYEPTARLLWTPDRRHSAWGAVSRAVRTPARISDSLFFTAPPSPMTGPMFPRILGNPDFRSEVLIAYELGYRAQASERFSYDIATFYNVYDHLMTVTPGVPFDEDDPFPTHKVLPLMFANGLTGDSYGVELATNWAISDHWRLYTQYTFLRVLIHGGPKTANEGDNPLHQVYLRSSWDLRDDLDFDLTLRYVDCIPDVSVPSYVTMDLRLAWRPRERLELAVVGQNLLQAHHQEFAAPSDSPSPSWKVTEVPRGVYGTLTWRR